MTMKEAMQARHTVRKYTDKAIPAELVELLNNRIEQNNKKYGLHIKLVCGNPDGLAGAARLFLAKGVNNYFILAGEDTPDLDEKLGYCGADLILYAQTLGLNTWWVGGMFSRKGAEKNLAAASVRVNGIIVTGFGQMQGVPHKSKKASQISEYAGEEPQWFKDGVEGLLLAPTALNKQAFTVKGKGRKVFIVCNSGRFEGVDLGIGKYHFELGAGTGNFEWDG